MSCKPHNEPNWTPSWSRRKFLASAATAAFLPASRALAKNKESATVAICVENSHLTSLSDDAITAGVLIAIDDLNSQGSSRYTWEVITHDNGSMPGRASAYMKELQGKENLVGVFGGKFSPVVMKMTEESKKYQIPLFVPWAAADVITTDKNNSEFVFRLSMRDSWAMSKITERAVKSGYKKVGFLAPNSAWGRSCLQGLTGAISKTAPQFRPSIAMQVYNWGGEATLLPQYLQLLREGAQVLILVANEPEAGMLAKEISGKIDSEKFRLPILSHWGITGGDTVKISNGSILDLDVLIAQTFNFNRKSTRKTQKLAFRAEQMLGINNIKKYPAQAGIAHAYDLMMMIGNATKGLSVINGQSVSSALKILNRHEGVIRDYIMPFGNNSHDALRNQDVFFCRYNSSGELIPES